MEIKVGTLQKRIRKVKDIAKEKGIEVFLVCKPENKYYLTGFKSTSYYVVLTPEKNYLLTDSRYLEAAQKQADFFEVVLLDSSFRMIDFLCSFPGKTIGVEEHYITLDFYKAMAETIDADLIISAKEMVEQVRIQKDKEELAKIEKAATIADQGFTHILNFIKPGMRESAVAFELEYFMRSQGAQSLSFETIVASGVRSCMPHGTFTDKKLEKGDLVTLDFGCKFEGYCSDMTRTIGIEKVSEEQKKVYQIVQCAQESALEGLSIGKKCSEVDAIARKIITDAGYGSCFGHGLGHGVGLEIHEKNTLNPSSEEILTKGAVVTAEPGIYIPGAFGVRIEDLVIIEKNGIKNLTSSKKELIII